MTDYVYDLATITEYVKNSYTEDKRELFDDFFIQKALDELLPVTENDLNNFKDIIYDKTRRGGYLIYLDGYYFYQPFDSKEDVPMYYRTTYNYNYQSKLSISSYINNFVLQDKDNKLMLQQGESIYDFNKVLDYYNNREEYDIVGIIDKENNNRKTKRVAEMKDVFKIRNQRAKILSKKRETGLPSFKGAVCAVAKDKKYLLKVAEDLGIKNLDSKKKEITREDICNNIMDVLIEKEKYATGKDKKTYIMIPFNHPQYKFPLNLEDRVEFVKNDTNNIVGSKLKYSVKENKKDKIAYKITFESDKKLTDTIKENLETAGWIKENNIYSIIID